MNQSEFLVDIAGFAIMQMTGLPVPLAYEVWPSGRLFCIDIAKVCNKKSKHDTRIIIKSIRQASR